MQRFLVLCLATIFLIFEPISSTNSSNSSTPATTATPTPLPATKSFSVNATFNMTFSEDYTNKSSTAYINLKGDLTKVLNATFHGMEGYIRVEIISFSKGSVVCDFKVIFNANSNTTAENVKERLENANKTGGLGAYRITKINLVVLTTTAATTTTVPTTTAAPTTIVPTTTAAPTNNASTTLITPTATPTSTPPKSISVVATFNIRFKEGYKDKSSVDYKYLEGNLTKVLNETFHEMPGYLRVEILSFRSGSVICDFKVIFETTANPSAENVKQTLQKASDGGKLGEYTVTNIEVVASTTTTPTTSSSDKIWDKVIFDYLGGTLISFIVMVAAVGLCLILLIALICTCIRYRKLKKKTQFPKDLIINNDSAWINSHDNLLMWERNLRATEVNPAANAQNRPTNEKRP